MKELILAALSILLLGVLAGYVLGLALEKGSRQWPHGTRVYQVLK